MVYMRDSKVSTVERLDQLGQARAAAAADLRRATAILRDAVLAAYRSGQYKDAELASLARVDRMTVLRWTGRRP